MRVAPELKLGLFLWIVAIVVPWVRAPAFGPPYGLNAIAVSLFLCGCFFLPACSRIVLPLEVLSLRFKLPVLAVLAALSVLALAAFYRSSGVRDEASITEIREAHVGGEVAVDAEQSRLFSLCSPALAFLLFEISLRAKSWRWLMTGVLIVGIVLGMSVISFGGRFDALCCGLLLVVGIVMRYSAALRAIPRWRLLTAVGVLTIAAAVFNAFFAAYRQRDGLEGASTDVYYGIGEEILEPYGLSRLPFAFILTIGMVDEYLWRSVERFGMYLEEDDLDPAWGQHNFGILTRRLGYNDGTIFKVAVDDMYARYDIDHNVWATLFRELSIDFKVLGTAVVCVAAGFLFAYCRTLFCYSWFSGFVAAIIATIVTLSPFTSAIKSVYIQAGLIVGVLLLAVDVMSGYRLTGILCLGGDVEELSLNETSMSNEYSAEVESNQVETSRERVRSGID
jgi:hypothetical protein